MCVTWDISATRLRRCNRTSPHAIAPSMFEFWVVSNSAFLEPRTALTTASGYSFDLSTSGTFCEVKRYFALLRVIKHRNSAPSVAAIPPAKFATCTALTMLRRCNRTSFHSIPPCMFESWVASKSTL